MLLFVYLYSFSHCAQTNVEEAAKYKVLLAKCRKSKEKLAESEREKEKEVESLRKEKEQMQERLREKDREQNSEREDDRKLISTLQATYATILSKHQTTSLLLRQSDEAKWRLECQLSDKDTLLQQIQQQQQQSSSFNQELEKQRAEWEACMAKSLEIKDRKHHNTFQLKQREQEDKISQLKSHIKKCEEDNKISLKKFQETIDIERKRSQSLEEKLKNETTAANASHDERLIVQLEVQEMKDQVKEQQQRNQILENKIAALKLEVESKNSVVLNMEVGKSLVEEALNQSLVCLKKNPVKCHNILTY